ncbi:MAG TPA: hypothetical protein VNX18_24330 [Bryobacteraceae bacterium]|jgi:hypothetical protein|nr:hypothetical protein [Bryobacteraceae bacterium]
MARTLHAVFDGRALQPEESAGLEPNRRYLLTVEDAEQDVHPLATLVNISADLGVPDLAERHDDYARRDSNPSTH